MIGARHRLVPDSLVSCNKIAANPFYFTVVQQLLHGDLWSDPSSPGYKRSCAAELKHVRKVLVPLGKTNAAILDSLNILQFHAMFYEEELS